MKFPRLTNLLNQIIKTTFASLLLISGAKAQVVPDRSLPNNSTVDLQGDEIIIDGGTRAGSNLFHSFEQFSIPENNTAFFDNGLDISNIFSRITGTSISEIQGLIRANGTANLFLINPNGIVFGDNASLQIGGSFIGTTASGVLFPDGEFSAVDLDNPPLITINAPIGLNFRDNPASINNSASLQIESEEITDLIGLRVADNKTLGLIGGDIQFDGGIVSTTGGRIELGSIAESGTVNLTETDRGWNFTYPEGINFGNITLSNGAVVTTFGNDTGDIQLQARDINLKEDSAITIATEAEAVGNINFNTETLQVESSRIFVVNEGVSDDSGNIAIAASERVIIVNGVINNQTLGAGKSGDIAIDTASLELTGGGRIAARTADTGNTGDVIINASDRVLVNGIDPETSRSSVIFNTIAKTAQADSGNIEITSPQIEISEGGKLIVNNLGVGNSGDIILKASELIEARGVSSDSSKLTTIQNTVEQSDLVNGNGGDIIFAPISADNSLTVNIADGAIVTASTFAPGNPGDIKIDADTLNVFGEGITNNILPDGNIAGILSSGILSRIGRNGISNLDRQKIGNIEIRTNTTNLKDGGIIASGTLGMGNGGDISIQSDSITIEGTSSNFQFPSGISSQVGDTGIGNGGNINLSTNFLSVKDGGQIKTGTLGEGNAGAILIQGLEQNSALKVIFDGGQVFNGTTRFDELTGREVPQFVGSGNLETPFFIQDDNGNFIIPTLAESSVSTSAIGEGGAITINTDALSISNNALLTASSNGNGNIGQITIEAGSLELNNRGTIEAETNFSSPDDLPSDNITLNIDGNLTLANNSLISARATEEADGGNINIAADLVVAFPENNDIIASAERGDGGRIAIEAQSLVGIEEREATISNSTNDIDASSSFGLDGIITIETLDVHNLHPNTELPQKIVTPKSTVAKSCQFESIEEASSFVVKGKGGVPPEITEPFTLEVFTLEDNIPSFAKATESELPDYNLVPAKGIIVNDDGSIILTAYPTPGTAGSRAYIAPITCQQS